MAIEKQYGEIIAVCDDCGEASNSYFNDEFLDLIDEIKSDGWVIKKEGQDWLHFCYECRMNYRGTDQQYIKSNKDEENDLIDEGDKPTNIFDKINLG